MAITKPPVLPAWADTAAPDDDIVQPSDADISAGWLLSTLPPARQRWNWVLNFVTNAVRYFSRRGVADYDAAETYLVGDIARGDDGLVYRSLVNANTAKTPSTSATEWGSPLVPTPAADDSSTKIANTAYVLGQVSITAPVMNGAAAVGTSKKFARADHVHPSDSTKANTNGAYGSMSVGFATNANAAPWAGITGKPTTVGGYGIIDAITTSNIGSQSVAFASRAGRAAPLRSDGAAIDFIWSGQGGQPNWLLGGTDGVNFFVYNPANFSVNFATSAGQSTTQPIGTANALIATTAFANPGASLGSSGYQRLPSGLILQWGYSSSGIISFPISFPNVTAFAGCSTSPRSTLGDKGSGMTYSVSRFGMGLVFDPSPNAGYWFAVGY